MRRRLSSKSDTCTESLYVDAADISVKVSAHYPGRSATLLTELPSLRGGGRKLQKSAEGIVVPFDRSEGPNVE
jgi:alpha-D-ribose 1-methylphosphonate 5-triphosphate synthase subunit PhnH